jgi:hypothetical protein
MQSLMIADDTNENIMLGYHKRAFSDETIFNIYKWLNWQAKTVRRW